MLDKHGITETILVQSADLIAKDFANHVRNQLFLEEKILRKIPLEKTPNTRPIARQNTARDLVSTPTRNDEAMATTYGNYLSLHIRREDIVYNTPKLSKIIRNILKHLEKGTNSDHSEINVYIVSPTSDEISYARTTPNGDIFLSTDIMGILESEDELAGLLGHEVAHYLSEDGTKIIKSMDTGSHQGTAVSLGITLIAVLASGLLDPPNTDNPRNTVGLGEILTAAAITNTILISGANIGGMAGRDVSDRYFSKISQDQEISADLLATEYLFNTGYNYKAWMNVLARLEKKHGGSPKEREQIDTQPKPGEWWLR